MALVRDQLWAEAVHFYNKKEPLYLEKAEVEALGVREQEVRHIDDGLSGRIESWLEEPMELFDTIGDDGASTPDSNAKPYKICARQIWVAVWEDVKTISTEQKPIKFLVPCIK